MSKQNKTINFLYEASKLLPTNEIYKAIRSRMLIKCSTLNPSASLQLNVVPRCDACGILFKDVPPINIIEPVKKPKCYNKIKNGARNNTKYQNLNAKKFIKHKNDRQILIKQCKLCKNQIKTPINKTGHIRTKILVNPLYEINKKKKLKNMQRKKNREFSGLKKSAVLSVKRSLETEERSPKKLKTDTNVINLITPEGKKRQKKEFSTPEITSTPYVNVLTPNTIHKKIGNTSTPCYEDSDVICLDSPRKPIKEFKTLNDMFTPIFSHQSNNNKNTVIEISDADCNTSKKNKKKKNKKNKSQAIQIIEQTPKLKNNNNVVLVAEQSAADKKKKKLNNLSLFLKNASNIEKPNHNKTLQNFLSTFT